MKFQNFLGSKIFYATLAGLTIIGLTWAVSRTPKPENVPNSDENGKISVTFGTALDKDSDRDGVKDWEEALWNMDPENPDTLGRGNGDREEIENQRNLIKIATSTDESLTETDVFGRQLLASFASLEQSGNLNSETLDELSTQIRENLATQVMAKIYVQSDLNVVSTGTSSIEAYRKAIIELSNLHKNDPLGSEINAMAEAASTGSESGLSSARKNAPVYEKTAKDYSTAPVPNILAANHLRLVNGYASVAAALYNIENMVDDPLIGFIEFYRYRVGLDQILTSFGEIARYYSGATIVKSTSQ